MSQGNSNGAPVVHRPDKALYFLLLAVAARTRADCLDRLVGAVISRDDRVLSSGYSGTPFGVPNCSDSGCARCARTQAEAARAGQYDACVCVHAEQNAILTATRYGQRTLDTAITSTMQPCFGCLKELLQAGISEVRFFQPRTLESIGEDPALTQQYVQLRSRFRVFARIGDPSVDIDHLFDALM